MLVVLIMSTILIAGGVSAAKDTPKIFTTTGCGDALEKTNSYSLGDTVYVKAKNLDQGSYELKIKWNSGDNSCNPEKVVTIGTLTIGPNGKDCVDTKYKITNNDCGTYKVVLLNANGDEKLTDKYDVISNTPMVPEFGLIAGLTSVTVALGMFFFIRKR